MTLDKIQKVVAALTDVEFAHFAEWFGEYRAERDSDAWDEQIARDAKAGRLDALAERAMQDVAAGRYFEIIPGGPLAPSPD